MGAPVIFYDGPKNITLEHASKLAYGKPISDIEDLIKKKKIQAQSLDTGECMVNVQSLLTYLDICDAELREERRDKRIDCLKSIRK